MTEREQAITITSGTIIRSLLIIILLVLLYLLRDLVLVVLTAIVIASAIEPAVSWFSRFRVPRVISVLLVYLAVAFMVAGILYFFLPPLLSDLSDFLSTLPEYLNIFQAPITGSPLLPLIGGEFSNGFTLQETITVVQDLLKSASQGIFTTVSTVFGGVFSFILIVVFSFYFAMQETSVGDFLRVITPLRHQAYVINLWKRSQHKIGLWMQGQLLLALVVGVLVYLGLAILNVKYALILAFIAAILELIPVFGPVLAAIPAILVAFAAGGTTPALLVTGLYVIIQQFENHLIYPLVVTKVVGVPPLLVILALIIGANLAGFLGMILSVPAAAVAQEIVADIQKRRTQAAGTSSA